MWEDVSDPWINESQFKVLAQHWISDKAKSKNANRPKPSQVQLYICTRTRKDGSIVSSEVAKYMDLMNKRLDDSISTRTSDDLIPEAGSALNTSLTGLPSSSNDSNQNSTSNKN